MRHLLLRWAACVTLLTGIAFSARAEADCIYIIGHDNWWERPCTDNAEFFADRKLYETSPGSNVYEGTFSFSSSSWFRLLSDLPVAKDENDYSVYKQYVIAPFADGLMMEPVGKSGLYSTSTVKMEDFCSPYVEPGTWRLETGSSYMKQFKVIANLNVGKIFLVPTTDCVVVPDGKPDPTLDNAADYISANGYEEYIPAGKLSFNYYDFNRGEWWNNASAGELTDGYNEVTFNTQATKARGYSKSDWKGGVVTIPYQSVIQLSENSSAASVEDVMYVHRASDSFTPWQGASQQVVDKFDVLRPDGEGNYTGTLRVSQGDKINFISALSGSQDANSVICPAADRAMSFNDVTGLYYSSAVVASQADGAYWIVPAMRGSRTYTVTVTPGTKPVVKFEGEKAATEIYLIGAPQGWNIADGSMTLKKTVNGGYYGNYEISAADAIFRFYTSLGDWESNSLGSQYDDMPMEFGTVNGEQTQRLIIGGKGAFQFSEWPGGMMYMYVEPSAERVTFSDMPIEAAGEYAYDNADPKGVQGLYTDGGTEVAGTDGVYEMTFRVTGDDPQVIKLYTYKLPISRDEAEAEGSYALTLPDGFSWKFDDLGVAEATFTVQEGVTAKTPNHITVQNPEGISYQEYNLMIDMNTHKMYLERSGSVYYLFGTLTDGKLPSYADRADFRKYAVKDCAGFVDIPKDKLDFCTAPSIAIAKDMTKWSQMEPISLTFEEGVADFFAPTSVFRVKADEWAGGRLFVSGNMIMDARNLDKVYGYVRSNNVAEIKRSVLTETASGSMVYEGDVAFVDAHNPYMYFSINNPENQVLTIGFASTMHYNGIGYVINEGANELVAKNGIASGGLRFHGSSFFMPSVKGNGTLKVKVDLNHMEMTAEVANDNKASVYESVSENSSLDELIASESDEVINAVTLNAQINVAEGGKAEFNFASPDGELIVPATGGSAEIRFGDDGVWEGDFVKVATSVRARSAARKAAADNTAKWSISLPEGEVVSRISMLINEDTKKIKVFSSAHKTDGFFLMTYDNNFYSDDNFVWPTIETMDKLPVLAKSADGLCKGEVNVPETGLKMMVIKSLNGKYTSGYHGLLAFDGYQTFTLGADGDEVTLPAWNNGLSWEWTINAPAGKALITYDEKANKLTVKSDVGLGVDDMTAEDGTAFRLTVGDGCVTVTSDGNLDLDFANATGAVVKHASVTAGTTTINLTPGFYIVAGQKIFVR